MPCAPAKTDFDDFLGKLHEFGGQTMGGGRTGFFTAIWIFFFLIATHGVSFCVTARTDTIPPVFTWVSPAFLSIITTNTVRVAVEAHDNPGGSGIDMVRFYAKYLNDNSITSERIPIGEAASEPFEIIWDCSRIPDQNIRKLSFACEVFDHAGNVSAIDSHGVQLNSSFVLDRNALLKNSTLRSHRIRTAIRIDGDLNEWARMDSIRFANNDNIVTVYSLWDRNYLYFGIRVDDQSIIGTHTPSTEEISNMPSEDIAEIYLDSSHDHSAFFADACRHYLISSAGKVYEERGYLDRNARTFDTRAILHPRISGKCMVDGTLNTEGDTDRFYTVELAVPWSELGVKPHTRKNMGLEVWNSDRDYRFGRTSYAGWTTTASNLKNPSEWGDLVFVDDRNLVHTVMLFAMPVLLCLAGAFLYHFRHRRRMEVIVETPAFTLENAHIRMARSYIEEHYREETLSREDIARHCGLNASYFGNSSRRKPANTFPIILLHSGLTRQKRCLSPHRKIFLRSLSKWGSTVNHILDTYSKKRNDALRKNFEQSTDDSPESGEDMRPWISNSRVRLKRENKSDRFLNNHILSYYMVSYIHCSPPTPTPKTTNYLIFDNNISFFTILLLRFIDFYPEQY